MKAAEDKVREYKYEKRQNQHEEKMARALEAMKELFTGQVPLCRQWGFGDAISPGLRLDCP
jgi:hypothetical protein